MTEPIDHDRRVFNIPLIYHVKCTLHILAKDVVEARAKASAMDESDVDALMGFDDLQLWVNSTERLKIDDMEIWGIDNEDAKPNPDYDPSDHPDWAPFPVR